MAAPVRDIPVVEIGPLVRGARLGDVTASAAELEAAACLDNAARGAGFFYITGHEVPAESISGTLNASERLFALPDCVKLSLRARGGEGAGYEPSGAQKLDEGRLGQMLELGDGVDGESGGDQKESYIAGNMTGNGGVLDAQWPPTLDGFEEAVTRYHADCRAVAAAIMRGFAIALGLTPDRFAKDIDDPFTKLRLLRYPKKLTRSDGSGRCDGGLVGCGAHTDWGALTLLIQDDVGGLEVCAPTADEDGCPVWMPADPRDGAILANVGDMLFRWTNGRYRSAPHRVLEPKRGGKDRYSAAFFLNCKKDAMIDAAELGLNKDAESAKWSPITAMGYIEERVAATYSA
jgi:isopenicillin N synthase-like dioxygenase